MNKYNGYTYEIRPIEVLIGTGRHEEHEATKTGYDYIIHDVYISADAHESDEWYDTESEAVIAAENKIDEFCEGKDPNYDVEPYGQIDWDERRRMGE